MGLLAIMDDWYCGAGIMVPVKGLLVLNFSAPGETEASQAKADQG